MSQPFDRGCKVPAPGAIDSQLNEFWVSNPWDISSQHNLSAYERNRTYLNVDGDNFVDISFVTGADSDGDGRCVVAADLNGDGRQELIVRQAGGGPIKIFENRFPQQHWLKVSLEGVMSNRLGVGARITAKVGDREIVRTINPINSFRSQAPCLAHFGLEDEVTIDELTVHWPSGHQQTLTQITADQHIVIREDSSTPETKSVQVLSPSSNVAP